MPSMTSRFRTSSTVAASLLLAASLTAPALALEPLPKSHKERERHIFRDVQMGLSHPTPEAKAVAPTAPKPLFPWLPPAADPNRAGGSTGAK